MTPAEQQLWAAISNKQLAGLRFRAQHPVGQFIVDFYCPKYKLAIELDGPLHMAQREHDEARTEHIQSFGYRVIRFRNAEVFNDLNGVMQRILQAALETGNANNF